MTQAQEFKNLHSYECENQGWTGVSLNRHPTAEEATEEEAGGSSWCWKFSDGSYLSLVPGQMTDSVYVN